MPVLSLDSEKLMIGAGGTLVIHDFAVGKGRRDTISNGTPIDDDDHHPKGKQEGEINVMGGKSMISCRKISLPPTAPRRSFEPAYGYTSPLEDITGLINLPDGQIVTSNLYGVLQRLKLPRREDPGGMFTNALQFAVASGRYEHPVNNAIESLSVSIVGGDGNGSGVSGSGSIDGKGSTGKAYMLTAAHDGLVSLYDASSPWKKPSIINVDSRPWSSHLDLQSPSPFAAIGISAIQPLLLFDIDSTGLRQPKFRTTTTDSKPSRYLGGSTQKTAVYDMTSPSHDSPSSLPPCSSLLTAWFDGFARLYDLRQPLPLIESTSTSTTDDRPQIMIQKPCMAFTDPWSDNALYSCAFSGHHVVAGGARHGMVHVWDPRMTRSGEGSLVGSKGKKNGSMFVASEWDKGDRSTGEIDGSEMEGGEMITKAWDGGWSIYTPSRTDSPVYSLQAEGSRIYGAMDLRAFVLSFDVFGSTPNSPASKGWDVVGKEIAFVPNVNERNSIGWGGRRQGEGRTKDYATGYRHREPSLRVFSSLGEEKR